MFCSLSRRSIPTHVGGTQLTESGRDELRDGRMDWRGVLKGRVGHSCIHHVEHAVNGFVAPPSPRIAGPGIFPVSASTTFMNYFVSPFSIARATGHGRSRMNRGQPAARACAKVTLRRPSAGSIESA